MITKSHLFCVIYMFLLAHKVIITKVSNHVLCIMEVFGLVTVTDKVTDI